MWYGMADTESSPADATMAKMTTKPKKHPGRRGDPVSLAPLTMDKAVDAIFQISPKDVKRIVASRPGKKNAKGK